MFIIIFQKTLNIHGFFNKTDERHLKNHGQSFFDFIHVIFGGGCPVFFADFPSSSLILVICLTASEDARLSPPLIQICVLRTSFFHPSTSAT